MKAVFQSVGGVFIAVGWLAVFAADTPEPIPAIGTVEWAKTVRRTRETFENAATSTELKDAFRRLLVLYNGCTRCRKQAYRVLEFKLKTLPQDTVTAMLAEAADSQRDPLSQARLLVESGRAGQAKQIVTAELRKTKFPERRLHLLEVLAEANGQLGDQTQQRRVARQLLDDTPVTQSYCDKALIWMSWLGEDPPPTRDSFNPKEFPQRLARLRELEARRGNDGYVSCRVYRELDLWDRFVWRPKQQGSRVNDDVLSLFPDGINAPLLDLARRTSDPRVRAALLLSAASRVFATPETRRSLPLIREAKAVSDLPSIQIGASRFEAVALGVYARDERQALALNMIDRYPRSEASCDGCVQYWNALHWPFPDLPPNRTHHWREKCLSIIRACPNQIDTWLGLTSHSPEPERRREMCRALLDMGPPDEVVPTVLLSLSEALRDTDPKRAWEIERAAIVHPEFPGLDRELHKFEEMQQRADRNGDLETDLYLEILSARYWSGMMIGGCIPGDRSLEIYRDFRRMYLNLRMGDDPEATWSKLIGMIPTDPEDRHSRVLLKEACLDRLVRAAIATHQESSALDWFRNVRQRFRWSEQEVLRAQSMLDGYVRRLEELVPPP